MAPISPWPRRSRYGVPGSMAGDDNFGCCGLVQGLCGLLQLLLFPRSGGFPAEMYRRAGPPRGAVIRSGPPAARELRFDRQEEYLPPAAAARSSPHLCSSSSQVGRMGSSRDAGISSDSSPVLSRELRFDRQEENFPPVDRNSTAVRGDLFLCSSSSRGARRTGPAPDVVETSSDEDDCVILDSDPHGAVAVTDGRESGGGDGGSDAELQIVGEKGQVACRDFPHSRHLCSNMPFGTTSHERHCTMCYCFVCDVQAPCGYWGKGLSVDDHCHATDKESKWEALRQVFRCSNLPASHPQNEISQSLALTASVPRPYSATRVQSGTSNGHTAQVTRLIEPTVSAPRPHSATGAVRGTSDVHTAQISHRLALTVSAPRASSATRVQSGASNGHSAQVTHLVEATVNAPRSHPEAGAGRGTSNTHTAQVTRLIEPTVSAPRPHSATGAVRGTSDVHTAQISHRLALTVSAPRASSATRVQSGASNGHSAQVTHLVEATVNAPRSHPEAGAGRGTSNTHTAQVTRLIEPTVSAPRPHSATGAVRGTSDVHTAQISHRLALTVSAPRASSATRVQSGASNGHSAQVTHLVEATVNAPRSHPEAGAGRGTSNTHTALVTRPSEPTVSAARPYSAARTGRGTSNARTSQITRPVEQTVGAPRVYPAAGAGRDSSNAHSSQITYPAIANGYLPEPDAPEGATVYVGNLPYHIDNERLKLSFQHAGVVLFSKVIYDRETGKSRGYGFVTMNTVQEAEAAVRMYHGSVVYGRPLTVNIAAPRGSARVGHQSGSPLKLFVCNLPTQVDHSRLKELFSKHGKVVDARVVYERRGEDWCSRGFGFVTMATEEEAHNAVHSLHKQVVYGRPLTVNIAAPRAGAPVDTTGCQSGSPLKIFVSNLPTQVDHSRLEELFSKHGRVVDARVVYESREGASCSRGFGFVTMATKEEAHNAIRALNKQVLEGNPLGVKVARERPERGCPSPSNQIPLQNAAGRSQDTHTSVRASPNVAPTVSVPRAYPASRARSGTQSRPEHRGCFAIGLGGRELEMA